MINNYNHIKTTLENYSNSIRLRTLLKVNSERTKVKLFADFAKLNIYSGGNKVKQLCNRTIFQANQSIENKVAFLYRISEPLLFPFFKSMNGLFEETGTFEQSGLMITLPKINNDLLWWEKVAGKIKMIPALHRNLLLILGNSEQSIKAFLYKKKIILRIFIHNVRKTFRFQDQKTQDPLLIPLEIASTYAEKVFNPNKNSTRMSNFMQLVCRMSRVINYKRFRLLKETKLAKAHIDATKESGIINLTLKKVRAAFYQDLQLGSRQSSNSPPIMI